MGRPIPCFEWYIYSSESRLAIGPFEYKDDGLQYILDMGAEYGKTISGRFVNDKDDAINCMSPQRYTQLAFPAW